MYNYTVLIELDVTYEMHVGQNLLLQLLLNIIINKLDQDREWMGVLGLYNGSRHLLDTE